MKRKNKVYLSFRRGTIFIIYTLCQAHDHEKHIINTYILESCDNYFGYVSRIGRMGKDCGGSRSRFSLWLLSVFLSLKYTSATSYIYPFLPFPAGTLGWKNCLVWRRGRPGDSSLAEWPADARPVISVGKLFRVSHLANGGSFVFSYWTFIKGLSFFYRNVRKVTFLITIDAYVYKWL